MSNHWINHGLPFRPSGMAYGIFSKTAGGMPPLEDSEIEKFARFKTARDLADAQESKEMPFLGPNPVGMEWTFDIRGMMISCAPNLFVHDWAYDLSWSEANGKVFCCGMVVAESLPEFLARLRIENDIWWSLAQNDDADLCTARTMEPEAAPRFWARLERYMPPRSIAYLRALYESAPLPSAAQPGASVIRAPAAAAQ